MMVARRLPHKVRRDRRVDLILAEIQLVAEMTAQGFRIDPDHLSDSVLSFTVDRH